MSRASSFAPASARVASLTATPVLVGAAYIVRAVAPRRSLARPLRRGGCHVSAVLAVRPLCDLALVYSAWACILLAHGGMVLWDARALRGPVAHLDRAIAVVHALLVPSLAGTACTFGAQVGLLHRRFASALFGCAACLVACFHLRDAAARTARVPHVGTLCAVMCAVVAPMLSSVSRPKNIHRYLAVPIDDSMSLAVFEILLLGATLCSYRAALSSALVD